MVGGGLLAAGLAGGVVTLVLGFPAVWAVVTAVGAFLLGGSGVATLIQRYGKDGSGENGLAVAVARISEELEAAEHVLQSTDASRFFARHELATVQWEQHGDQLVGLPELHREVRAAYISIDAMNNRGVISRSRSVSGGSTLATLNTQRVTEARSDVGHALMALGDVSGE